MYLHLIWKINCEIRKKIWPISYVVMSNFPGAWTASPPFSAVPKVQSCDFLVRGGSIRRIRVLRRCLRRLRHPNETTSLVGENSWEKRQFFSVEGCWKFQTHGNFELKILEKSWRIQIFLVKSDGRGMFQKYLVTRFFWRHWCWHLLVIMTE